MQNFQISVGEELSDALSLYVSINGRDLTSVAPHLNLRRCQRRFASTP